MYFRSQFALEQDDALATGGEAMLSLSSTTNFDDIDEEDKAGRNTRLFKRHETQGYLDMSSLEAASVDKVHRS